MAARALSNEVEDCGIQEKSFNDEAYTLGK